MTVNLHESTTLAEAADTTSAPTGRMSIQIITPGWGSSGYYPPKVLELAATNKLITKGTPMYLDHPTEAEAYDRPGRSVRDMAAVFTEDAHWTGDALVAEAQVFTPYRALLSEMAEHIGVSIRGSGDMTEGEADGRTGNVIESLDAISSVDFVTAAGRGGRVLELLESAHVRMAEQSTNTPSVPADPAGQQAHTPTGDNMAEIEEARLRRLEEADRRVPVLEGERDQAISERDAAIQERNTAARALAESRARGAAETRARGRLTEANATLPAATVTRIVEAATRTVPLTDQGQLDEAAFDTAIDTARTTEETYLASVAEAAGAGTITGFGATVTGGTAVSEADLDKLIANTFQEA